MQRHNHRRGRDNQHVEVKIMKGPFIQKWVFNSRTGRVDMEIDEIRSQYPPTVESGYAYLSTVEKTSILVVPSAHRFMLRFLWVFNNTGSPNILQLYDGPGVSVSVGGIAVAGSQTDFINFGDGVIFKSAVHVSNLVSTVQVRVGGLLIKSGPE